MLRGDIKHQQLRGLTVAGHADELNADETRIPMMYVLLASPHNISAVTSPHSSRSTPHFILQLTHYNISSGPIYHEPFN